MITLQYLICIVIAFNIVWVMGAGSRAKKKTLDRLQRMIHLSFRSREVDCYHVHINGDYYSKFPTEAKARAKAKQLSLKLGEKYTLGPTWISSRGERGWRQVTIRCISQRTNYKTSQSAEAKEFQEMIMKVR